jgi:integrase
VRTTFSGKNDGRLDFCTKFAQHSGRIPDRRVKFPVTIRHRSSKVKIYAPGKNFAYYRLCYTAAGKRRMQTFLNYSQARQAGERIVREIAQGSQAASLSGGQSRDALAAFERLEGFYQSTGRRISLLGAISEFVEAATKLRGRTLGEAVAGYMRTVVTVKSKGIAEAVEEFIESRKHKSESRNGKRAQLSASYATHVNSWLREFASTFPGTAVCDLSKEHLNAYIRAHADVSPKNRNDRRATVKMFLTWAARNDYLPVSHRLFEADGMAREIVETAETDFYRPDELQKLLDNADAGLRSALAIAGLAGLRGEEIMRLDWADVWRVPGNIEVTAGKSKTRQRRLVEICPALAAWLEPCRKLDGKVFPGGVHVYQRDFLKLRGDLKIPDRRNGLRHAFCTYHFALHANENQTAAQAGNSPQMIHAHYKGLATKAEAEKWFNVMPSKSAKKIIQLTAATARA